MYIRDTLTSRALSDSSSVRNFPIGCLASCVPLAKKAEVSTMFLYAVQSIYVCRHFFRVFALFFSVFFIIASGNGIPQIRTSSSVTWRHVCCAFCCSCIWQGCRCRLLLHDKVERQKSATKVSYVIGLRLIPERNGLSQFIEDTGKPPMLVWKYNLITRSLVQSS